MRGVAFALGVLVGLGVGWLAFRAEPVPQAPFLEPTPRAAPSPALEVALEPMAPSDPEPAPSPPKPLPTDVRRAIVEGSHAWAVAHVQQHGYLDDAVEALIERARKLYAEGDKNAFLGTLTVLAEADHAAAHAYFVELLPLTPPDWPESFKEQGARFQSALARAHVSGLAAAARQRIEASGVGPGKPLPRYWRELLVQHGGVDDRAWLIELDGTESQVLRVEAGLEDSARARRAVDAAIEAWRAGRLGPAPDPLFHVVRSYVYAHSGEGVPLVREALRRGELGGAPITSGHARDLALVSMQGQGDVAAAAASFVRIPDAARRYGAYYALFQKVGFVHPEGEVATAVEDLTAYLEGAAEGTGRIRLSGEGTLPAALGALATWHGLPSGRLLTALERVVDRLDGEGAAYWQKYAAEQRDQAEARWK